MSFKFANPVDKIIKSDFNDKKLPLMKSVINTLLNEKQLIINWDDFK